MIRVSRSVNLNQRGEVVGVYRILRILTERKKARSRGKYAEIQPAHYTDEDYERIELPGDHHFHLDPEVAAPMAEAIEAFLDRKRVRILGHRMCIAK